MKKELTIKEVKSIRYKGKSVSRTSRIIQALVDTHYNSSVGQLSVVGSNDYKILIIQWDLLICDNWPITKLENDISCSPFSGTQAITSVPFTLPALQLEMWGTLSLSGAPCLVLSEIVFNYFHILYFTMKCMYAWNFTETWNCCAAALLCWNSLSLVKNKNY